MTQRWTPVRALVVAGIAALALLGWQGVTTVGRDEEVIRAYIRNQELAYRQLDQLELKISAAPKSNQSS